MNNPFLQIIESEAAFLQLALEDVELSIKEVLDTKPDCRIALAGGNTPEPLYKAMAESKIPWEKIKLIQTDERYVPSDHKESNLGMLRRTLLNHIPLPPNNLLTFDTSLPLDSASKEMSRKIIELSHDRFPIFDLLILGVGDDGHIASLFEGEDAMTSSYYATPAIAKGYETEQRLTLSLISLRNSARALILLKGAKKLKIWDALHGKNSDLQLTALQVLIQKMPVKVLYLP